METNLSSLVRVSGRDSSVSELVHAHIESRRFEKIIEFKIRSSSDEDYAQIDPQLATLKPTISNPVTMPDSLVGYGGLSPQQRYRMLTWLADPAAPAPEAIQQLYVAHLETNLFELDERSSDAIAELCNLLDSDSWRKNQSAWRALLLGYWAHQEHDSLGNAIVQYQIPEELLGISLGHLALQGAQLTPALTGALISYWKPHGLGLSNPMPPSDILEMRLTSWKTVLNADPLQHTLAALPEHERQPKPWRCVHRNLRISVPQPNVEPILRPLLSDAFEGLIGPGAVMKSSSHSARQSSDIASGTTTKNAPQSSEESARETSDAIATALDDSESVDGESTEHTSHGKRKWSLVLEFGHSRSEYFDFAIFRARQRPGYSQIMDEDRTLIHRIVFTKSEMRHFWILWEYVQNWSNTQVYVNGKEIEKWKVWPYSQHLR